MKFIDGMTNEKYHSSEGYSKSSLDLFNCDPYSLEWAKNVSRREGSMGTLSFGTAVHAMLLEPEKFDIDYVSAPKVDKRTRAGKQEWQEFVDQSKGKLVLTDEESTKLRHIRESVMAHKQCRHVLECDGVAERSYFWTDPDTGLNLRCRPDREITSEQTLIDVKTTADISKFKFSVEDYRYHVQDAFYCDGVSHVTGGNYEMLFLLVQTTVELGRYPVRLVKLPEFATEFGRSIYRNDLNNLADFLEYGYSPVQELEMHSRFENDAEELSGEVVL